MPGVLELMGCSPHCSWGVSRAGGGMLGVMMGPGVGGIHGGCEGMPGSSKAVRALGAGADSAAEGVQGAVELGWDRGCQAGPQGWPPS